MIKCGVAVVCSEGRSTCISKNQQSAIHGSDHPTLPERPDLFPGMAPAW
ncbi:MAG: hypothetical protein VX294_13290 [Candidatus Latescibacterota bacterium]|nr:hypothetical protein [Candidatus Latescibacterota bacterium]